MIVNLQIYEYILEINLCLYWQLLNYMYFLYWLAAHYISKPVFRDGCNLAKIISAEIHVGLGI